MSNGIFKPAFSISFPTVTISSKDGVMRPDNPRISALFSFTASRMVWHGHITPISMTLKLLHPKTTATMFFPISCTSPFTVAIKNVPALELEVSPAASFAACINGSKCPTDFFITLADLITCGKNIFPAPNKSPTTFMPSMSGPSMISRQDANEPDVRHSSVSAMQNSSIPCTRAYSRRLPTFSFLQAFPLSFFFAAPPAAWPLRRRLHGPDFGSKVAAN
mmetsp:Transcript_7788/g.24434  ORF Transcript_7788/g.24434 Transcript_7788/m.24434 type:complete len:220 (-) Transcript_7788:2439-3098(-)